MALTSVSIKGGKELTAAIRALGPAAIHAAARAMTFSAEAIMTVSKSQYVPVETGTLRGSGFVKPAETTRNSVSVTLGYGGAAAPYALSVHENPRAGKTGGMSPGGKKYKRWAKTGEWKYLETPVKANLDNVYRELKIELDKAMARGGR